MKKNKWISILLNIIYETNKDGNKEKNSNKKIFKKFYYCNVWYISPPSVYVGRIVFDPGR